MIRDALGMCRWGVIRESLEPAPAPEDRESLRGGDGASPELGSQTQRLEPPRAAVPTVKASLDALQGVTVPFYRLRCFC